MTLKRENQILWYLLDIADENNVPWFDYFEDECDEYKEEIEPMDWWDALIFLVDKRLAAEGK